MICPRCRGTQVESNRIGARANGLGVVAKSHPVAGAIFGAIWLATKAIDASIHEYQCRNCKHTFSSSAHACKICTTSSGTIYEMNCCKTRVCEACLTEARDRHPGICGACGKALIRQ